MGNENKKPKFKVGETAYVMRNLEITKVVITECYMMGNEIKYCCYLSGYKILWDRISEEYLFKTRSGGIIENILKMWGVEIELINGNEYKMTINETEE